MPSVTEIKLVVATILLHWIYDNIRQ